ncbi:MAG TPA: hypothetical protein VHO25_00005, partial [Polyangiaceae bacterium]|nr:hypothetical protein [Polyangiaceae bacterium]
MVDNATDAIDTSIGNEHIGTVSQPVEDGGACVGPQFCDDDDECQSDHCNWSTLHGANVCFTQSYEGFNSSSALRHFDEVTSLPNTGEDPVWQVSSGQLFEPTNLSSGSYGGTSLIYSNALIADGWVAVDARSPTDDDRQGVIFRYQDPGHYYLLSMTEINWGLWRFDAEDTKVTLASGTHSMNWATSHNLKIEGSGGRIQAYIDGNLKADVIDDTYKSGRVGVYKRTQLSAYFDNLYAVDTTDIDCENGRKSQEHATQDVVLRGGDYDDDNFSTSSHYYVKANSNLSLARKLGMRFAVPTTATVTNASLNLVNFIGTEATIDTSIKVW